MLRRIVRHAEYQTFNQAAYVVRLPHFTVPVRAGAPDCLAYGITIAGKLGNAVRRNLLKRRIKAWFIQQQQVLPTGWDIVLIARMGALQLSWEELKAELILLIEKLQKLSRKEMTA